MQKVSEYDQVMPQSTHGTTWKSKKVDNSDMTVRTQQK